MDKKKDDKKESSLLGEKQHPTAGKAKSKISFLRGIPEGCVKAVKDTKACWLSPGVEACLTGDYSACPEDIPEACKTEKIFKACDDSDDEKDKKKDDKKESSLLGEKQHPTAGKAKSKISFLRGIPEGCMKAVKDTKACWLSPGVEACLTGDYSACPED